jgi:tRNA pseudouridine13 synthase
LYKRCEQIRRQGVPNYFGEQRFGHDAGNLVEAERLFTGRRKRISRHKRSLYLSAARSWLFNAIVSHRVLAGSWNKRVRGDVFMLDGRSACFTDDESSELAQRIERGEIHPTAVLWGAGESMTTAECEVIESAVVDQYPDFKQGLIDARVQRQRRAMRLMVRDIDCSYQAPDLLLSFSLPAGSYATMVLRELVSLR